MDPQDLTDVTKRRQMEYATQFFGYTPDSLVDVLVGDVSDIVSENLRGAKKHTAGQFPAVSEEELEEAFKTLSERFSESAERIFFKFGAYLKDKILTIPNSVLLPEDKVHESCQMDGAESSVGKENVDLLCRRLKVAKLRIAILKARKEELEQVLKRQDELLKKAKEVQRKAQVLNNNKPISSVMCFL